jgi:hypothetical protein
MSLCAGVVFDEGCSLSDRYFRRNILVCDDFLIVYWHYNPPRVSVSRVDVLVMLLLFITFGFADAMWLAYRMTVWPATRRWLQRINRMK